MYSELVRSFDSLNDTNAGGVLNMAIYNINNYATLENLGTVTDGDPGASTVQKRFVAGIDLDRFNHSSDILMSGTSTIGQQVSLQLGFAAATAGVSLNLYCAIMHDVLYHIEGGQMLAKF